MQEKSLPCFFWAIWVWKGIRMMTNDNLSPTYGDGRDRREFERLVCSRLACSCSVKPESGNGSHSEHSRGGALLSNISPDGVKFETNFRPSAGDFLRIEVRPIEGPEMSARIQVLHAQHSEKNGFFSVGSRFEEMSELDRQNLLVLIATINRMQNNLL
jgi:hypothetical protein